MMITVINTRDKLVVWVVLPNLDEVSFVATDHNEWSLGEETIPESVQAILRQIYLNCRNLAPLRWVSKIEYSLNAEDKMFLPLWAWLEDMEGRENQG